MAESVTVTWGEQNLSPVPYNGFRVGPFSMTTEVRSSETPEQAMERAHAALDRFARATYERKLSLFREHLMRASAAAGQTGR